ncbi:MAG: hypothetical protein ACYTET_00245 [Planctomycetota bacterium]|jgi:hypothetical protein
MAGLFKRGNTYYAMYYVGGKKHKVSLKTDSRQLAKAKLRQIETKLDRGEDNPLPTKTPLGEMLNAYVDFMETFKTAKSVQTDVYYLRSMFGDCCEALQITARRRSARAQKKPEIQRDRRRKAKVMEVSYLEQITTPMISEFITAQVSSRGLAPKTANRFREILSRLFSWAMTERGIKMPGDKNPATAVSKYREKASEIRFLTLPQIDEQLEVLDDDPQMRAMVGMLMSSVNYNFPSTTIISSLLS